MPRPQRSVLTIGLIGLIGAIALWQTYAWFQGRFDRAFDQHAASFEGYSLRLPSELAGPGAIRKVHFADSACACSGAGQQLPVLEALTWQRSVKLAPAVTGSCYCTWAKR